MTEYLQHEYSHYSPCVACVRESAARRHGAEQEHEITGAGASVGNTSIEHEVTGCPQSPRPRSSGYRE
jgi:hypothetical protein